MVGMATSSIRCSAAREFHFLFSFPISLFVVLPLPTMSWCTRTMHKQRIRLKSQYLLQLSYGYSGTSVFNPWVVKVIFDLLATKWLLLNRHALRLLWTMSLQIALWQMIITMHSWLWLDFYTIWPDFVQRLVKYLASSFYFKAKLILKLHHVACHKQATFLYSV